ARMEFAGLGAEIPKRPALARYWRAVQARPSFAAADIWTRFHPVRLIGGIFGLSRGPRAASTCAKGDFRLSPSGLLDDGVVEEVLPGQFLGREQVGLVLERLDKRAPRHLGLVRLVAVLVFQRRHQGFHPLGGALAGRAVLEQRP